MHSATGTWPTMAVPVAEKIALLLEVNAAAITAAADFVAAQKFCINEQKYFASSEDSYIDQNIDRLWLPITVTAVTMPAMMPAAYGVQKTALTMSKVI
jgi:predicted Zn-dependent protease